jgi:hypothetical protein
MAVTSWAGANGFSNMTLFGTPLDDQSAAWSPVIYITRNSGSISRARRAMSQSLNFPVRLISVTSARNLLLFANCKRYRRAGYPTRTISMTDESVPWGTLRQLDSRTYDYFCSTIRSANICVWFLTFSPNTTSIAEC